MAEFTRIVVIYNPKSTGATRERSLRFQRRAQTYLGIPVEIIATLHRGHAEELARAYAESDDQTMIISCSGDGGYHEVVNGALTSKKPSTVLGLLPGGNANDHYAHMHTPQLLRRISTGQISTIDVLRIRSSAGWERYAHSYVGIGMTAELNEILQRYDFHPLREIHLVVKHIFRTRPVRITVSGKKERYDSLLFLNTNRMSKFVKTGPAASIQDGKFELVLLKKGSVTQIVQHVVRAATVGFRNARQMNSFSFTCRQDMPIQMDGEQRQLSTGETITIEIVPRAINCII